MRRVISVTILSLIFLITQSTLGEYIQPNERDGHLYGETFVYIHSDGRIDPPTANITTNDNVTYTFTYNINATLSVLRDNIIVDGAGYTLQSVPSGTLSGVYMNERNNVTITNLRIFDFQYPLSIGSSSHNTFANNDIRCSSGAGFILFNSHRNIICGNNITGSLFAFMFADGATENRIFNNTISNIICLQIGSGIYQSNVIYHNNFINVDPWINDPGYSWDNGYPSGGNYWSGYTGTDSFSGPYQNETGNDGIGDNPYVIGPGNRDRYPFTTQDGWENNPFSIESNVTIINKVVSPANLCFNVSDQGSSTGYVNVTMPKGLNSTTIKVFLDETELIPPPFPIIAVNSSHYSIYFEFVLSKHQISIQFALGDIAVTEITLSRTVVGQGYSVLVNATLANIGDYNTTISVTSQSNSSVFGNLTDVFLAKGASESISFVWNTTDWSKGNYSISIHTTQCEGEANISNNFLSYGEAVCVTIPGDVDADFDVDIFDIVAMAGAYGSLAGEPEYNANYDLIYDGQIDIFDIVLAANHYGEEYTP